MRFLVTTVAGAALLGACGVGDPAAPRGGPAQATSADSGGDPRPDDADAGAGWAWTLPVGFPTPRVPEDNPMNEAKVELGRRLFYDKRLSGNGTQSCGSCHEQRLAFTDGRAVAVGSTGQSHKRSSLGLANVAYASSLTWANPLLVSLEQQALVPLFGDDPVELGMGSPDEVLARLRGDATYERLFPEAFPEAPDAFSFQNVTRAIAAFERTLLSGDTRYDRWQAGEKDALSASEKRGMELFFSERLECYHCHGGFLFSDSAVHADSTFVEILFHNTGLYNLDGQGAYPDGNRGVFELSGKPQDMGMFRAPSLRNIAVTAPYMHDGSVATLDEVLDHYAAGGRTIPSGPFAGVGSASPLKSDLMRGFVLTPEERADVLAFLRSLTDERLLTDPKLSDPFSKEP